MPPFLLLLLSFLLFQPIFGQRPQDDRSWPCLLGLCPDGVTACSGDFGCPPPNCDPSIPSDSVCEGSKCERDQSSPTGGKCGTFVNFDRRSDGEQCTKHSQCRALFLCRDGHCRASLRVGAYTACTIGGGEAAHRCPEGEECFTEGTNGGDEGVCLKPTTDRDKFQLDERAFGGRECANDRIGEEEGPCLLPDHSCHVPFMCSPAGCCIKTIGNRNGKGQRLPPQPVDPNCRDALDSGESEVGRSKCVGKEELCRDRIYRKLMREQCPKTCGYCDADNEGSTVDEVEIERQNVMEGSAEAAEDGTMKVDPSSACSDRKRPGRESDCPKLAHLCADSAYHDLMRFQCPKTCGFCGDGGPG